MEIVRTEEGFIDFTKMIMNAMKAKDKVASMTFKQIKSRIMEFKTQEVKEGQPRPVYDLKAEQKLLETMQKELEKDVKTYLSINTEKAKENASESRNQLNIITELLPKPASIEEIQEGVTDWILHYGAITSKDMGKVINHVVANHPTARKSNVATVVKANINNQNK